MRKLLLIALLIILGEFILAFLFLEVLWTWGWGEDSTLYPLSYDERRFRSIRQGYNSREVWNLLGRPLDSYLDSRTVIPADPAKAKNVTWRYTMSGRVPGSHAYNVREISFDSEGRVDRIEAYYEGD